MNPNEIESSPSVSGCKIAIISFLLFVAAISFPIKYDKTDEERQQHKKEDEKGRRVAKLESLKTQKEKEINQIISEGNEQAAKALSRYEFALSFETRLITLAKQAQEKYKEKNLRYRTDQLCPVFFTRPVAFKFTLFFDNVKPKSHETIHTFDHFHSFFM